MSEAEPRHTVDRRHLDHAARIALRGHGLVEPNPLVGCVVLDASGSLVGEGYHQYFGQAHAERIALARAGKAARGGTLYCTLEPCVHHNRTPPCTDAIIEAGIARVVFGTSDPYPPAAGGGKLLEGAGIEVLHLETNATRRLSAPFVHGIRTGLPWIVAKWAQTIDGRIATAKGDSQWISSGRSRRLVHRERGRVDAVMTGIGTVLADNPRLTPRDLRKPRRMPERIVVDGALQTPLDCQLVRTAEETPTIIICHPDAAAGSRGDQLRSLGVLIRTCESDDALAETLKVLSAERGYATVLVESGGGLLGRLIRQGLINDALIFIAPKMLGDQEAPGSVRGCAPERITDGINLENICAFPRNDDVIAWYRIADARP
jgi:diaminohydroxyphosphoribosylaminopyrimidine deaminase/5-amino-6-(5-phosphoribosylamino)uracil reductase